MNVNIPVPSPVSNVEDKPARRKGGNWWRVLLITFGLYIAGIVIMFFTGNPNLFPTIAILGNFMIPVAYVAFFYDRRLLSQLTFQSLFLGFLAGGLLGVFVASILEPIFIRSYTFLTAFQIGFIEEFVKILGVLVIARRLNHDSELDGMILGAAAGMSFAALESMGYTFTALLSSGGSFSATVGVTLLRGLLSPLGHGTWSAILVGVLFRESRNGRFRLDLRLILAYLTVAILHGLWDGLPGVIGAFTGSGLDVFISQTAIGLIGIFLLWLRWREAVRLQLAQINPVRAESIENAEIVESVENVERIENSEGVEDVELTQQ